jgi:hypothetical protein
VTRGLGDLAAKEFDFLLEECGTASRIRIMGGRAPAGLRFARL